MANERYHDEADPAHPPAKKQRKQRRFYSCQECRRLKMRCDRQVPCSNCVRRHKAYVCRGAPNDQESSRPVDQVSQPHRHPSMQNSHREGGERGSATVASVPKVISSSDPVSTLDFQTSQPQVLQPPHHQPQLQQNHNTGDLIDTYAQSLASAPASVPPQNPQYQHSSPDRPGRLEQRTVLACNLEPQPAQRHSLSPGSRSQGDVSAAFRGYPNGHDAPSGAAAQPVNQGDQAGSYGTLMVSKGGRSKYLGPTAGSEWLKDSETREMSVTPAVSRSHTPEAAFVYSRQHEPTQSQASIAFPFFASHGRMSTRDLLDCLPPKEEAWTLAESYYRYCAWHHDVAPKEYFAKTFSRVYSLLDGESLTRPVNPQEIALVYMIMAQGTLYNIEMAYNDSSAEDWVRLAQCALVKGDFLATNTIPGIQTLHLLAHHHLELDKGRRGDNAWPLFGLVMRLIQAMGMHRDGTRWGLPEDVVEERRRVFWECNAADIFQAHCFSRPCAINPEHCDTAFPLEPLNLSGGKSYSRLRYELSQLSSEILNLAMKVNRLDYSAVSELHTKLFEFESRVPYSLRCRAAFLSMPSRYSQLEAAIAASPEPSRRSMTTSFRQANLSLNIAETMINLHRPYYAKALHEDVEDRLQSEYALSYLAVIERCSIIIAIVSDIHARFPAISIRQWNMWYHVFGSALCLGALILRDPSNPLTTFSIGQIDAAINLFTSLMEHGARTPRYQRNLQWLIKLRAQASAKVPATSGTNADGTGSQGNTAANCNPDEMQGDGNLGDGDDIELIGWRTRLIERAGQRHKTIKTISITTTTPNSASDVAGAPRQQPNPDYQTRTSAQWGMSESTLPQLTPNSALADDFLQDFWIPILPDDLFRDLMDGANEIPRPSHE